MFMQTTLAVFPMQLPVPTRGATLDVRSFVRYLRHDDGDSRQIIHQHKRNDSTARDLIQSMLGKEKTENTNLNREENLRDELALKRRKQ